MKNFDQMQDIRILTKDGRIAARAGRIQSGGFVRFGMYRFRLGMEGFKYRLEVSDLGLEKLKLLE